MTRNGVAIIELVCYNMMEVITKGENAVKKRIISLLLSAAMLVGAVLVCAPSALAVPNYTASAECIRVLKEFEGFAAKPYYDYSQYTVGYGTKCPDDMLDYYMENGITEAEAEVLLRNQLSGFEQQLNNRILNYYGVSMTQNQFDAVLLFSYNCGTSWMSETTGTFFNAIVRSKTGNDLIRAFALWCNAGGSILEGLLSRRLSEANMYLNGVYNRYPPSNYTYVFYDANGGSVSPRSQGYDANLRPLPFSVPTRSGYTFSGWYTARTGGTRVTVLDASVSKTTLYAHWSDGSGTPEQEEENPVTVKVTATDVNIRKGPGTNYAIVGTAQKNDQLVITATASGSGYIWGKYEGGWICLSFTNYDEAVKENATPPAGTSVMGTVNVSDSLNVRSGPGTTYSVVAQLKRNDRVEILEQSTVDGVVWGRISSGWVSMAYIILDKQESGDQPSTPAPSTGWTGVVVNCNELRIRSDAGITNSIVGYLKSGTTVEISEKKTVGNMEWGKISNGWISLDYVKLTSGDGVNTEETATGTVKVNDYLRVRSGPGTSYSVTGYLKPNEKVTVSEKKTVDGVTWGRVSNGWVSLAYVDFDRVSTSGSTQPSTVTKTVTADCLSVRSGPGTGNAIVSYLRYGARVTILETQTVDGKTWGKISSGWIAMQYTK